MIDILKKRFLENMSRHPDLSWEEAEGRLAGNERALEALGRMEETGGEPDTIGWDGESGKLIFLDCSAETPAGRRSLCYDDEALKKRKKRSFHGPGHGLQPSYGGSLQTAAGNGRV